MAVDFWLQRLESNQHNAGNEPAENPFLNSAIARVQTVKMHPHSLIKRSQFFAG